LAGLGPPRWRPLAKTNLGWAQLNRSAPRRLLPPALLGVDCRPMWVTRYRAVRRQRRGCSDPDRRKTRDRGQVPATADTETASAVYRASHRFSRWGDVAASRLHYHGLLTPSLRRSTNTASNGALSTRNGGRNRWQRYQSGISAFGRKSTVLGPRYSRRDVLERPQHERR